MIKNCKFINYIFNRKNDKEKDKEENLLTMKKNNMKTLKQFEKDFITAIFYDYTKQIPTSLLMEIDKIYTEETKKNLKTNFACSNCILKLMRLTGILYFRENPDSLPEELKEKFNNKYNKK